MKLKAMSCVVIFLLALAVTHLASADPAPTNKERHWAFQPISQPVPPAVEDAAWVRNSIDRFVLYRLEAEKVDPAPAADPLTLLRRVHLDITGLPPTPAVVEAFLADPSPTAYEAAVERLLASPHFGERLGRYWLDMARYADSDGYEKDRARPHAWRWRDWVIHALNRDLPFDAFTIEQLAGDLLPDATTEQRVATGFHRNTLLNTEGGVDAEEDRVKRTVDRTNTLGKVWLGITLECAQCHTHKYDPFTQSEYYSLYSFFNSLGEPNLPAPYPEKIAEYLRANAMFESAHEKYQAPIAEYERSELPKRFAAWLSTLRDPRPQWHVVSPVELTARHDTKFAQLDDGSIIATGKNDRSETYTLIAETKLVGITAVRLEALPDERFGKGGPGRAFNGNFFLSSVRVRAEPIDTAEAPAVAVTLENAEADFEQLGQFRRPIAAAIDDDPATGWSVYPKVGEAHVAMFEFVEAVGFDGGTRLTIELNHGFEPDHNLGRFRLSVTTFPSPVKREIVDIFKKPSTDWTDVQRAAVRKYYATVDPEFGALRRAADEHAKQRPPDPGALVQAQTVRELEEPRATRVHIRGNFLNKGAAVAPGVPAVLPPFAPRGERPDRLDLARWLFAPEHPLTSRVIVNRIWQQYFGRGLVASDSDFGTQGDAPSHPALLDWLARRFGEQRWSLKELIRLIVTSATYRQSSDVRPELLERDPLNTWLARQNRLRVEAEVIRDLGLATSGLLHPRIGGPSVHPPQPAGVHALGFGGGNPWTPSTGSDRYRRGLYTFFQRVVPYPMLVTFDAADTLTSCTRRLRTNTPLQALTLWNDPVFFEMAQALGSRIVREAPSSGSTKTQLVDRIRFAFLLCFGREPRTEETRVVRKLFEEQVAKLKATPQATSEIIGAQPTQNTSPVELAAWVLVGRTLMNMDEFITRE